MFFLSGDAAAPSCSVVMPPTDHHLAAAVFIIQPSFLSIHPFLFSITSLLQACPHGTAAALAKTRFFFPSLLLLFSFFVVVYLIFCVFDKENDSAVDKVFIQKASFSLSLFMLLLLLVPDFKSDVFFFFSTKEKDERIPFFFLSGCCCVCCRSSVLESVLNVPNRDGKCRRPHALVCSLAEYFYSRKLSRSPFMTCTA